MGPAIVDENQPFNYQENLNYNSNNSQNNIYNIPSNNNAQSQQISPNAPIYPPNNSISPSVRNKLLKFQILSFFLLIVTIIFTIGFIEFSPTFISEETYDIELFCYYYPLSLTYSPLIDLFPISYFSSVFIAVCLLFN